jgi:hypothetical protein
VQASHDYLKVLQRSVKEFIAAPYIIVFAIKVDLQTPTVLSKHKKKGNTADIAALTMEGCCARMDRNKPIDRQNPSKHSSDGSLH